MFVFNAQQLRTEYLSACYANERKLNQVEFVIELAKKNIIISEMTAMLIVDEFVSLKQAEEKELVTAW